MSPDRWNRPQFSPFEMSHLEGVIRDRKIQVRPTRHEEHARPDRLQCANEIALVEFVGADVGSHPCRRLSIKILRLSTRESRLPVKIEVIVEIAVAGSGQMKVGAIPVLTHPPASIDPRERAHGLVGVEEKRPPPICSG